MKTTLQSAAALLIIAALFAWEFIRVLVLGDKARVDAEGEGV